MKMPNLKKKAIALAVANASMIFALDVASDQILVTSEANAGSGSLREALGSATKGDHVLIDATRVTNINLDSEISFYSEGLIISAPVDDAGRPRVTITATGEAEDPAQNRIFNIQGRPSEGSNPVTIISGLELTGGYTESGSDQAWGGAIQGIGVDVFLDKTVIADNKAHGAGGGIAIKGGSLCLRGSEVSGNTVGAAQNSGRKYAIGGGAAVSEGVIVVVPSIDEQLTQGKYVDDCLLSDAAQAAFTDISEDFSLVVKYIAVNPGGVDIITSAVTGNTASVSAGGDSGDSYSEANMVVGGGLASVSNATVQVPSWIEKYSPEPLPVGISVSQAEISDNKALIVDLSDASAGTVQAAGGGLFVGQPRGVAPRVEIFQSVVSGNEVTVGEGGEGGAGATFAVGAGVGTVSSDGWYAGFWEPSIVSPGGGSLRSKYKSPNVNLSTSTVTGNTITATHIESTDSALIMGGGVGMYSYGEQNGIDLDKYQMPVAVSLLSVVSGNSIDVKRSNSAAEANTALTVIGGGIGVVDGAPELGLTQSKYFGYFSAAVGNDITVTSTSSVDEDEAQTSILGGGVSAGSVDLLNSKPQFTILSGNTGGESYFGYIPEAVLTAAGGTQDNAVTFNSDGRGDEVNLFGGGLAAAAGYLENAQVLGNSITIDSGNTGSAEIVASGGGAAFTDEILASSYGSSARFARGVAADNKIIVTSGADVSAAGGGIFSASALSIDQAEISGNKIETVGSSARGGGLALMPRLEVAKYTISVENSTIANNQLTAQSSSAVVAGAGIAVDAKFNYSEFVLDELTIVGNTGSRSGTPEGGQLNAVLAGNDINFFLEKSLISGDTTQGASDFIYDEGKNTVDVAYTAVFWGAAAPAIDGFLDPSVADPAFLGSLANNGGKYAESPFGGTEASISTRTIALLDGSKAINAAGAPGCDPDTFGDGVDQRDRDRDECGDIGAFEAGSDVDLDGLTDSVEQTAAGTDLDILKSINPESFALLLKNGDGNSDGLPDYDQNNVASFSTNNDGVMTLAVTSPSVEGRVPALVDVSAMAGIEAGGYDLSLGGVSFTVLNGDGTDPVGLSLIVPNVANATQSLVKRVCNSEFDVPKDPEEGWEVISTRTNAFGSDRLIFQFELTPNGPFDCNGSEPNILDPIYVATGGITPPPGAATPVPSMPGVLYVLLSGAMGLLGLSGLRSRKKKPRQ